MRVVRLWLCRAYLWTGSLFLDVRPGSNIAFECVAQPPAMVLLGVFDAELAVVGWSLVIYCRPWGLTALSLLYVNL